MKTKKTIPKKKPTKKPTKKLSAREQRKLERAVARDKRAADADKANPIPPPIDKSTLKMGPTTAPPQALSGVPNIGAMQTSRGTMAKRQFNMWDAVPDCTTACVAYEVCPKRIPEDVLNPPRCEIRVRYIDAVLHSLKLGIKNKKEIDVHKIGLLLIPLYSQLISFKIQEHAMNNINSVMIGSKINPIYKEIRSIILGIDKMLSSLGIEPGSQKGKGPGVDKETYGDGEYYDSLFDGDE